MPRQKGTPPHPMMLAATPARAETAPAAVRSCQCTSAKTSARRSAADHTTCSEARATAARCNTCSVPRPSRSALSRSSSGSSPRYCRGRARLSGRRLDTAAGAGALDVLRLLITHNASVNAQLDGRARHREGETPSHFAAAQDRDEALLALIAAGADVQLETVGGMTALHVAAGLGHVRSMRVLEMR